MPESMPHPEQQPLPRTAMATKLYELINQSLPIDTPSVRVGGLYGERSTVKELPDGDVVALKAFPYSGFTDHNFIDPSQRLRASIAVNDGPEFTVWDMDPIEASPTLSVENIVNAPEVFVTQKSTPDVDRKIFRLKLGTAVEKTFNHLFTYGVFIGGVEQERRQRLHSRIHAIKLDAGITKPASDEDIRGLVALLDAQS